MGGRSPFSRSENADMANEFLQADNNNQLYCTLTKKARKITAAQHRAKRILSVYIEPCGLCAMRSLMTERQTQRRNDDWQSSGEDA
jgi:hypothetical protein